MAAVAAPSPRAWCERAGVGRVDRLIRTSAGGAAAFRLTADGALRRVAEFDRRGTLLAALRWGGDGALLHAAVRIPEMTWLAIEPGRGDAGRWGASDMVRRGHEPLTSFEALDWRAVDRIPALAEPARLPPHGGTALLNLIAALAADQGRSHLAYRGPWPTEALFLALLESFRYEDAPDPLAAFSAGGLSWMPAPHARVFSPEGAMVQIRDRVEKVVWDGRAYHRPDWQGVRRRGARMVRDDDGRVVCGLEALDAVLDDHLILSPAGDVLEVQTPAPEPPETLPLEPAIAAGVVALVAGSSAPALASSIRAVASAYALEWGPVRWDLALTTPDRARLAHRLRRLVEARLAGAATRAERLVVALAALHELADLVGDDLRARAQRRLEAAAPEAQRAALEAPDADASLAADVGRAAEAWLSGSRGR
ncbi:MAG: hypothetical protein ACRELS_17620 [Candidatus Rokuibacteriota bacterium]